MAVFAAAVGAIVILGMVEGRGRNFDRGVSSTASVVAQESLGALTLAALVFLGVRLRAAARGGSWLRVWAMLAVSLILASAWWYAYLVERAS